jgi:hypothetical protein
MQDKTSRSNSGDQVSQVLREYISELVEDTLIQEGDFEKNKKWLRKNCELSNVSFEPLEQNLEEFFLFFAEYDFSKPESLKRVIERKAAQCFITEETLQKCFATVPGKTAPNSVPEPVKPPPPTVTLGSAVDPVKVNPNDPGPDKESGNMDFISIKADQNEAALLAEINVLKERENVLQKELDEKTKNHSASDQPKGYVWVLLVLIVAGIIGSAYFYNSYTSELHKRIEYQDQYYTSLTDKTNLESMISACGYEILFIDAEFSNSAGSSARSNEWDTVFNRTTLEKLKPKIKFYYFGTSSMDVKIGYERYNSDYGYQQFSSKDGPSSTYVFQDFSLSPGMNELEFISAYGPELGNFKPGDYKFYFYFRYTNDNRIGTLGSASQYIKVLDN